MAARINKRKWRDVGAKLAEASAWFVALLLAATWLLLPVITLGFSYLLVLDYYGRAVAVILGICLQIILILYWKWRKAESMAQYYRRCLEKRG
jgi:hypothetical protein